MDKLENAKKKLLEECSIESKLNFSPKLGWADSQGIVLLTGDVSKISDVDKIYKTVLQEYGAVDYLVNSAGILYPKLLVNMDPHEAEEIVAVNLFGTINMSRSISKIMLRRRRGGCIVNVASVLAIKGQTGQSVYSATKVRNILYIYFFLSI